MSVECSNNGVFSGFNISRDNINSPVLKQAQCSGFDVKENLYNLKKGDKITNTCNCETIAETNGEIMCPSGKYITSYSPSTKSAKCCSLCDAAKSVHNTDGTCSVVFKDNSVNNISCAANEFMKGFNINKNNTKISCCSTNLIGQSNDKCSKYGLDANNCNDNIIDQMANKCKEYGLNICTIETIKATEQKCNDLGMRFFDPIENKYKNTDSYMMCHSDNFAKMEESCKTNDVSVCNFYNLKDKQTKDIKNDIIKLDAIQTAYEKELNEMTLAKNKILGSILIFFCFVLTGLTIYIVVKK